MPQGEDFWNPYRLIPAKEPVVRRAPWTNERFQGHSGIITCTLKNLTPLFIGTKSSSGTHHPHLLRDSKPVVPGSSLKGMLRSLVEIVGGGCFVVHNSENRNMESDRKKPKSRVPPEMSVCREVSKLCIACRMFGAMERGQGARVHKGKVSIGDACLQLDDGERLRKKKLQVLLDHNAVRHEAFYKSVISKRLDGKSRKVYFHQPKRKEALREIETKLQDRAWSVEAILPGHCFEFEVQFTSLDDAELSLLLYILQLEKNVEVTIGEKELRLSGPMCHKIGNAKPLGMGSCHIQITKLTLLPSPEKRFSTLKNVNNKILEGEQLQSEILERIRDIIEDQSPTMQALRKMMVWDENDPRDFHYPDHLWFQNLDNKNTPLKLL